MSATAGSLGGVGRLNRIIPPVLGTASNAPAGIVVLVGVGAAVVLVGAGLVSGGVDDCWLDAGGEQDVTKSDAVNKSDVKVRFIANSPRSDARRG